MMNTLIENADIYTPDQYIVNGSILIEGQKITAVHSGKTASLPPDTQIIDALGKKVIPGLIDTHIHGAGGFDISAGGTPGAARYLATQGTTAFLPSTHFVMTHDELLRSIAQIAEDMQNMQEGAQPLGIHMEGPWIAADRSPFSQEELCYPITRGDIELFIKASQGRLRMVTFAPELPGSLEVIPWLKEQGIIPSIGHTNASYDLTMQAVALGLKHSTHTYNAMPSLHHRNPGALAAIMDSPQIYAELIADGFHVLPPLMRLLIKAKGIDRISIVSDAVPLAGMPAGTEMDWCGLHIGTDGEISILPDRRPAGAYKLLNRSLKILVEKEVASFSEAVRMASTVPAEILNVKKGRLTAGYDADLVILNEDYNPLLTMITGRIVFSKI